MTLLRKPFLLLLVLACVASLGAGGRFSLRLLFDTGIALAAIPAIQLLAFGVVYWTGRKPVRFASAVDGYFAGSGPWCLALAVLAVFSACADPLVVIRWFSRVSMVCAILAVAASIWLDFRYFHTFLERSSRRATVDLLVQRSIGWSMTTLYFLLTAVPKASSFLPDVAANVLGTRP